MSRCVNRHGELFGQLNTDARQLPQVDPRERVSTRVKLSRMRRDPTPEQIRDHVRAEREARRWSARRAADESRLVSNTTWSRYETTARLTDPMTRAVAVSFGWPDNWTETLPKLSGAARPVDLTTQRLTDLEQHVRTLAALTEWLLQREEARGAARPELLDVLAH